MQRIIQSHTTLVTLQLKRQIIYNKKLTKSIQIKFVIID